MSKTSEMRGMSDPVFFAFDILDDGRRMLCHAVIFTSFEIPCGGDAQMPIGGVDRDPRGKAFIKHVWTNYLKDRTKELEGQAKELEDLIARQKEQLKQLGADIIKIRKEAHEQS